MRCAHTVAQVRDSEAAAFARLEAEGRPEETLMRRAAAGLAYAVADYLRGAGGSVYGARVVVLAGAGNNGGDAMYAAAALADRGARVDALLLSPEKAHPNALAALRVAGGRVREELGDYDVAIDGIVGIGGSGPLRADAAAVVDALKQRGVPFVAVDTPSGVDVDTGRIDGPHVEAELTVTFGTHKIAHLVDLAALACGSVHLVDIGLELPPCTVEALQEADVAALLPRPEPEAQKYTRGVVGIRAGSEQYRGAGVLSVSGANTGLVGMVRYVPADGEEGGAAVQLVQAAHPEVVVGAGRVQAWVVGSGGGESAEKQLASALADDVPVVVDADALAAVTGPVGRPAVLTPHAGELARMLGVERTEVESDQLGHARTAAEKCDAVVLLKNRHTLAVRPDGTARVTTVGPPWLATAGAGDVLAGLIGALLAAGLEPYDAASVGSWLHGAAATLASRSGPITAMDVARAVPSVCTALLGDTRSL
jgi:hydroxyethylthiazole kinase-like uncharacterized protein yjeF